MKSEKLDFNLLYVINIALRYKKFIIALVAIASIITAVYAYSLKNNYRAYASFYPASTFVTGRVNMFRKEYQDYVDYFGIDNEIDRFIAIGNSGDFITDIIRKYNIMQHYGIDSNDSKANFKTYKLFNKKYKFIRGAYGNIEVMLEDEDITLAAKIVNDVLIKVQDQYRMYLNKINTGVVETFEKQNSSQDTIINQLSDSLAKLRVKYGIYGLVNPSRTLASSSAGSGSGEAYALGLEKIQALEELKDKYVVDRAKYESLMNEFKTALHKNVPFIHVIQYAAPGGEKSSPFRTKMVLGTALFSLFLGILAALAFEYFKAIKKDIQL